jgi:protein SCO1/2
VGESPPSRDLTAASLRERGLEAAGDSPAVEGSVPAPSPPSSVDSLPGPRAVPVGAANCEFFRIDGIRSRAVTSILETGSSGGNWNHPAVRGQFSSHGRIALFAGSRRSGENDSASPGRTKRRSIRIAASLALAGLLLGCSDSPRETAADITGLNWNGAPFRLHDQRGKVALLFFGFTHCPDICPGSFAKIRKLYQELPQGEREDLAVVFVSVDPERDTREKLAAYVSAFDPSFVGLSLDRDALARTAGDYGVVMEKRFPRGRESAYYSMDHTSTFFLIDRKGEIRDRVPFDVEPQALRAAIERLFAEEAPESRTE